MSGYAELALVQGLSYLGNAQSAIANNLANATTVGYKRRTSIAEPSPSRFQSMLGREFNAVLYTESTDWTQGAANPTNDRFNVALDGDRMFRVRDTGGRTFLTRRGELVIDGQGYLATATGHRYLDDTGQASSLSISPRGVITGQTVDGGQQLLGTLGIWQAPDKSTLRPAGHGLWLDTGRAAPTIDPTASVRQGYLEQSNVEVMSELVRMIGVQRGFQATTKALTSVGRLEESLIQSYR